MATVVQGAPPCPVVRLLLGCKSGAASQKRRSRQQIALVVCLRGASTEHPASLKGACVIPLGTELQTNLASLLSNSNEARVREHSEGGWEGGEHSEEVWDDVLMEGWIFGMLI